MITPGARASDPRTSHQAQGNTGRRPSMRYLMLTSYGEYPEGLTDDEAAIAAGIDITSGTCYWKRASELRAMDLIAVQRNAAGQPITRMGSHGALREVCQITDLGTDAIEHPELARGGK